MTPLLSGHCREQVADAPASFMGDGASVQGAFVAAEQRKWKKPHNAGAAQHWGVMASKLRPFDHIEVLADDGSFCAELLVLMATKTQATVMELRKIDIST